MTIRFGKPIHDPASVEQVRAGGRRTSASVILSKSCKSRRMQWFLVVEMGSLADSRESTTPGKPAICPLHSGSR